MTCDSLTADIRQALLTGELAVGHVITEGEMAERFGVSKTPVAEALSELAWSGWVSVLPRRGYRVEEVTIAQAWESLALLHDLLTARLTSGSWTPAEVEVPTTVQQLWQVYRHLVNGQDVPWMSSAVSEVCDRLERVVRLASGQLDDVPDDVALSAVALRAEAQPDAEAIAEACRGLRRWIQDLLMQSDTPLTR